MYKEGRDNDVNIENMLLQMYKRKSDVYVAPKVDKVNVHTMFYPSNGIDIERDVLHVESKIIIDCV